MAQAAGVSPATVSRILNGTARVADAKRQAVEAAIARLGFLPNMAARSLKLGRTMTVGVLTPDIASPFFGRVLRGLQDRLADSGYALVVTSGGWNADDEAGRARLLIARRIDALVVMHGHLSDAQVLELARQLPVATTGRQLEGEGVRGIALDQVEIGRIATRHLLALGHRRIAHIAGPAERRDAVDRRNGWQQALAAAGAAPGPELEAAGDFFESGGRLAMERLLGSGAAFSAVFAANDQAALGARMALHRAGVRVPDDLSIVGVDDLPAAAYATPPLTTVRQPAHEMGAYLAAALLQQLGHAVELPPLPLPELVARETTRRL